MTMFLLLCLLTLVVMVVTVQSYPTYLLSESGCMIDLDTTEVIMNALVRPFAETDDTSMHIQVNDESLMSAMTLKEPTKISLTLTSSKTSDYHFVLESTTPDCSFLSGSCDHQKRVSGRHHDVVELDVRGNCQIIGGWATGQEAVRLVEPLSITLSSEAPKQQEEAAPEVKEPPPSAPDTGTKVKWAQGLLNDCAEPLHDVAQVGELKISQSDSKLQAKLVTDNVFEIVSSESPIVLETSPGATWTGGTCGNTRILLMDEPARLEVRLQRNIYVTGIYQDDQSNLFRTDTLRLEWQDDERPEKERQEKAVKKNWRSIQKELHPDTILQIKNVIKENRGFKKKRRAYPAQERNSQPVAEFSFGTEYYMALGFMICGTFLVIQCFLTVSQRDKGRRTL